VLFSGSCIIKGEIKKSVREQEVEGLDPWILYLYAMKSPATKEKYLMRLTLV
jgi:hypothetical protein